MKMNNIISYNDFISEQLWSKGVERSKSGTLRKEDRLPYETNLYDLKPIRWTYKIS